MQQRLLLLSLLLAVTTRRASSFLVPSSSHARSPLSVTSKLLATRYGPPLDDFQKKSQPQDDNGKDNGNKQKKQAQAQEFQTLLDKVLQALDSDRPEHIPSLLTKHTELLLRLSTEDSMAELIQSALDNAAKNDNLQQEQVEQALEMIVSFVEDFVQQSKQLDDHHKHLLGKIIHAAKQGEDALDALIKEHSQEFTRGFLRHLEGECQRIASAPSVTPDSAKLRETLLVIHARILDEMAICQQLGEGALVLGQLIAYDDANERIAVLEAGLQVRGVEFAQELAALTEEALQGFASQQEEVDPDLVRRVQEIDGRVHDFIREHGAFQ